LPLVQYVSGLHFLAGLLYVNPLWRKGWSLTYNKSQHKPLYVKAARGKG